MSSSSLSSAINNEMVFYERIITETHFKKLILFSKLLIACLDIEKFKRVETNIKKLG